MEETYTTLNPLSDTVRQEIISLLNLRMADILDLHYQSLLAHWNVKGPNFIALHELLDDFAGSNGADNWCDWVAERISQLGGRVITTVQFIAAHSALPEYPTSTSTGEAHIEKLASALALVIVAFRDAAKFSEAKEDYVTCDILRQVQRSAEKYLWLLEAHVQS